MNQIFLGEIKDGKLLLDKGQQFNAHLHALSGKRVEVTVEKLKHPRTNSQNRYYHGVVVKAIAQHTGYDANQVHELLKALHSPRWYPPGKLYAAGIPTSTKVLDTIAFSDYVEKCRMWANEFLALQIPLPGEVTV